MRFMHINTQVALHTVQTDLGGVEIAQVHCSTMHDQVKSILWADDGEVGSIAQDKFRGYKTTQKVRFWILAL